MTRTNKITVRVSIANWVIARSGAPNRIKIIVIPNPTTPSPTIAASLDEAISVTIIPIKIERKTKNS